MNFLAVLFVICLAVIAESGSVTKRMNMKFTGDIHNMHNSEKNYQNTFTGGIDTIYNQEYRYRGKRHSSRPVELQKRMNLNFYGKVLKQENDAQPELNKTANDTIIPSSKQTKRMNMVFSGDIHHMHNSEENYQNTYTGDIGDIYNQEYRSRGKRHSSTPVELQKRMNLNFYDNVLKQENDSQPELNKTANDTIIPSSKQTKRMNMVFKGAINNMHNSEENYQNTYTGGIDTIYNQEYRSRGKRHSSTPVELQKRMNLNFYGKVKQPIQPVRVFYGPPSPRPSLVVQPNSNIVKTLIVPKPNPVGKPAFNIKKDVIIPPGTSLKEICRVAFG